MAMKSSSKNSPEKIRRRKAIERIVTVDSLKTLVTELLACLPGKPVNPGDKWESKFDQKLAMLGSLARTTTYTYEGKAAVDLKELHRITFTATVAYTPSTEKVEGVPFQIVKGKMETSEFKGTIYFDATAGRLAQSEVKMTLKGDLIVSLGTAQTDANLQQEVTSKTRVLEKKR